MSSLAINTCFFVAIKFQNFPQKGGMKNNKLLVYSFLFLYLPWSDLSSGLSGFYSQDSRCLVADNESEMEKYEMQHENTV